MCTLKEKRSVMAVSEDIEPIAFEDFDFKQLEGARVVRVVEERHGDKKDVRIEFDNGIAIVMEDLGDWPELQSYYVVSLKEARERISKDPKEGKGMSQTEDEMYGRLYVAVENAILDLMLLLDDIAREWAKARGIKAGALKRPDWNKLLEMRKWQEKGRNRDTD